MKKQLLLFLSCLMISSQAFADLCGNCCRDCFGFESVLTFDVGGGYRNDSLKWKRFPEATPGEVIQDRWSNIGMGVVEANASFLACEHFLVKADFDFGWFDKSGHQTYKVFDDGELLDSLKSRVRGNVYDLSGGVGYQFNFECYRLALAPLVGYGYSYQKYKSNKYEDELSDIDASYQFKNRFVYRWSGPWIGAALLYQPYCDMLIFFDYAFHWLNLRSRIKIVEEDNFIYENRHLRVNNAYGNEFTVGANYLFCDDWFLGIKFNYKNYWGNKGKFDGEGDVDYSSVRKLCWVSYNVTLDIGYKF